VHDTADLVRELESRFGDHPVRRFLDFHILELGADRCVMSVSFKPEFDNTTGAIHGGVLAMLADTAVAVALSTSWDGRMDFATSNLNIHYLRRAITAVTATRRSSRRARASALARATSMMRKGSSSRRRSATLFY
jgi:uncharacterized protein (TIGR00369 family)